jgi:hypothetical protein
MLESLLVAERGEFLREREGRNKGNGVTSNFESTFFGKEECTNFGKVKCTF